MNYTKHIVKRNCKQCSKEFYAHTKSMQTCSVDCRNYFTRTEQSKIKYAGKEEHKDYVVCHLCGFLAACLSGHLVSHKGYNVERYKEEFNLETASEAYKSKMSERVKGDKNPAYQHGGKFSPFSKKFIHEGRYDPSELQKKASATAKLNGNDSTTVEYFIKRGATEQEAEIMLRDRQTTFSLDKCIAKHGKDEGTKIWKERQDKWQTTLKNKSPEETAIINAKKLGNGFAISRAEIEITKALSEHIEVDTQHIIITPHKVYMYDLRYGNKIVEYNGDYWHCNPKKYDPDYFNERTGKTAAQTWEFDAAKNKIAIDKGFDVLVIWEQDYLNNKEEVIKECLNFLTL